MMTDAACGVLHGMHLHRALGPGSQLLWGMAQRCLGWSMLVVFC